MAFCDARCINPSPPYTGDPHGQAPRGEGVLRAVVWHKGGSCARGRGGYRYEIRYKSQRTDRRFSLLLGSSGVFSSFSCNG